MLVSIALSNNKSNIMNQSLGIRRIIEECASSRCSKYDLFDCARTSWLGVWQRYIIDYPHWRHCHIMTL